jgi:hypothetical protein
MADFRKALLDAILADGKIDEGEVKLLKKHFAGGKADAESIEFLLELRKAAKRTGGAEGVNPEFEKLFFGAVEKMVGAGSADKVKWLREKLFPGKKIDPKKVGAGEKGLLGKLGKLKEKSPELDALLKEAKGPEAEAPAAAAKAPAKPKAKGGAKAKKEEKPAAPPAPGPA